MPIREAAAPTTTVSDPAAPELSSDLLLGLISSLGNPAADEVESESEVEQKAPDAPKRPAYSTWPPAGAAAGIDGLVTVGSGLGPVKSRHRTGKAGRSRGQTVAVAVLLLAAIGGVVGWRLVPHKAPAPSWDPRVAGLATFVAAQTQTPWQVPVTVTFVPPSQWASVVSGNPTSAIGAGIARWVPSRRTLYVEQFGAQPDVYTDLAIVGQLTSAQGPGVAAQVAKVQAAYVKTLTPAAQAALARQEKAGH